MCLFPMVGRDKGQSNPPGFMLIQQYMSDNTIQLYDKPSGLLDYPSTVIGPMVFTGQAAIAGP